jgi:hypothetical protein
MALWFIILLCWWIKLITVCKCHPCKVIIFKGWNHPYVLSSSNAVFDITWVSLAECPSWTQKCEEHFVLSCQKLKIKTHSVNISVQNDSCHSSDKVARSWGWLESLLNVCVVCFMSCEKKTRPKTFWWELTYVSILHHHPLHLLFVPIPE